VGVAYGPHVCGGEGNECLRPSRSADELNFQGFVIVHMDHGAEIASSESVLRQISLEHDGIELTYTHDDRPG
jgi:hypothetical protein